MSWRPPLPSHHVMISASVSYLLPPPNPDPISLRSRRLRRETLGSLFTLRSPACSLFFQGVFVWEHGATRRGGPRRLAAQAETLPPRPLS